jgi:uncharacterized FlaG/YvyC family protein
LAELRGGARIPDTALDAVDEAAERADQLARENRELHFGRDRATGRLIVQVRDLITGDVLATISPAHALAVLSSARVRAPRFPGRT